MAELQLNTYERLLTQFYKIPETEDLFKAIIYYEYKFDNMTNNNGLNTLKLNDLEEDILKRLGRENCQIVSEYIWNLNEEGGDHTKLIVEAIDALRVDSAFNRKANDSGRIIEQIIAILLDYQDDDSFIDFGCGYGLLLPSQEYYAKRNGHHITKFGGVEINPVMCDVARALLELELYPTPECDIRCGNILKEDMGLYTKGYIYSPFDSVSSLPSAVGETKYGRLNQWEYVKALLNHIDFENGGKALALLYPRSLMDVNKNKTLQEIYDKGRIEAIIKLPRVLTSTYINPILVVFSSSNDKVKIMDCSGDTFFPSSIRKNVYLHTDKFDFIKFKEVYEGEDNEYLKTVSRDSLSKYNNWNPDAIIALNYTPTEGMELLYPLLEDLFIGPQLLIQNETFNPQEQSYKVLTVSDISSNYFPIDYTGLKEVNESSLGKFALRKYHLQKGDVLITTKSSKNKVTLIEEDSPEPVIPIGGIIVIRPNQDKLNPTYLKMYLESDEGQDMLKSISVSSGAVYHIPLESFRRFMYIRPLPLKAQNEKAEKYNDYIHAIRANSLLIEDIIKRLKEVYKEEE